MHSSDATNSYNVTVLSTAPCSMLKFSADVYLAMTGGQVSFDIDALTHTENAQAENSRQSIQIDLPVIRPSAEELEAT